MTRTVTLEECLNAVTRHQSLSAAAESLGLSRHQLYRRLKKAQESANASGTEEISPLEEHRLRRQVRELKSRLDQALSEFSQDKTIASFFSTLAEQASYREVPTWLSPASKTSSSSSVGCLLLSDIHFGEVVNPAEVEYMNGYNKEIALSRLRRFFDNSVRVQRDYLNLEFAGTVMFWLGDFVSGDIHDELRETNELSTIQTVLDLTTALSSGLSMLLDEVGEVHVKAVVGNHGRQTKKPVAKHKVHSNFDWLIYKLVERDFADDPRVSFDISESSDVRAKVLNTTFLATHGDQFRGGSGISSWMAPLALGNHRKSVRALAMQAPFDFLVSGHTHTYMPGALGCMVNGCFPAGTLIQTGGGVKPIEEVCIGEAVVSRDGSTQTVTNTASRRASGLVSLAVSGLPSPLQATPNHLIWAIKGESKPGNGVPLKFLPLVGGGDTPQWIPVDFVSPGDYVNIPIPTGGESPISSDVAWMYGLYLAEGSTLLDGGKSGRHHRIALTMHERELPVLERFSSIFTSVYPGTSPRVGLRRRVNLTSEFVVSPGKEVCSKFREEFGHKSYGKRLPEWAFSLTPELSSALLHGWLDGDGHYSKRGKKWTGVTTSRDLAYGMFRLALKAGYTPSLSVTKSGGPRLRDSYCLALNHGQESKIVGGEVFYRVVGRFRSCSDQEVFDLEVSGEHTYTAGLVGVHNSIVGYNEYAYQQNFRYEPPQQSFFVVDGDHGVTFRTPIHVRDANESWVMSMRTF